jgi:hypothetical protein
MSTCSSRSLAFAFALSLALGAGCPRAQDSDQERSILKESHAFKEYKWVDQRSGDCHISGILTLFDHGYAIWTASTKTDSSGTGDIWHESLAVVDSGNRRLFGFGVWDSPRMFPNGSQYGWRNTSTFPQGFFDDAAGATSSGDC